MKARILIAAALSATAAALTAGTAAAVPATSTFASPSRNIVCVYANQYGIGCKTLNNGRVAILRSFTGQVGFHGWVDVGNRFASRVIPYGRTVTYGGTFRVASSVDGLDVWSTLTGRGFHIDRDSAYSIG